MRKKDYNEICEDSILFPCFFEGATPHLHFHLCLGQDMTGQSSALRQEEDGKV